MAQVTESTSFSKNNPFPATLRENRLLSRSGSAKETRHFVVDMAGSGLTYTCGDSLGVYPRNRETEVDEILEVQGWTGEEPVLLPKDTDPVTLRTALTERLSLSAPTKKFLLALTERITESSGQATLAGLLAPEAAEMLPAYLADRQYIDLMLEFPSARFTPEEFCGQLRKLMPRLYSIASSPTAYPSEIHLTVAVVRYETNRRDRVGVCSSFLADRAPVGEPSVPVFVASSHFGLPENDDADLIMVGPGTGIAPFRSFVQERIARGAKGRLWVFFGDQHQATDFLYEEEFMGWLRDGHLARLDCAWSRDQAEKIYVQDKMREAGAELWSWLDRGAYFYVCGDAKRMAPDVEAAMIDAVATHGSKTPEAAAEYVKALKKEKRYQRDVY